MRITQTFFSALLFALAVAVPAHSEELQGIKFWATLGDVKKIYPNAVYVPNRPAWLQPYQHFYAISGVGMPGSVRVMFDDPRPRIKKALDEKAGMPDFDATGSLRRVVDQSDDEALSVIWTRWIPDAPIPMERYRKKYGAPDCSLNQEMQPICIWNSVGLEASMSEDQKMVMFVTTSFTKAEKQRGALESVGHIPDWLK